jgi:hypothetical protein
MSWKSVHRDDNIFLSDELDWFHRLLIEKVVDQFSSLNPKASTISLATSHLVINCFESQAMISCFLDIVDKTEVTSHQESDLLGMKETQFCAWESSELQVWDSRQNSRYGEYEEVYEAFSRLVK